MCLTYHGIQNTILLAMMLDRTKKEERSALILDVKEDEKVNV